MSKVTSIESGRGFPERGKFEKDPAPGYIRVGVIPPSEMALEFASVEMGSGAPITKYLILGDIKREDLNAFAENRFSDGKHLAISFEEFLKSNLNVEKDSPDADFFKEYIKRHTKMVQKDEKNTPLD